ncbi:MAG: hypothetical protein CM15mP83_7760 [Flavobacteriaceae bacterium]|nr:MAG: hypothetical protein CM15mP83_7760 [Flavobacteriaceae bacterium]
MILEHLNMKKYQFVQNLLNVLQTQNYYPHPKHPRIFHPHMGILNSSFLSNPIHLQKMHHYKLEGLRQMSINLFPIGIFKALRYYNLSIE